MPIGLATAGLIGAGISAAGTIGTNIGNIFANKAEAERQRIYNALEAEKNRNFQKEMRDTALISSLTSKKIRNKSKSIIRSRKYKSRWKSSKCKSSTL